MAAQILHNYRFEASDGFSSVIQQVESPVLEVLSRLLLRMLQERLEKSLNVRRVVESLGVIYLQALLPQNDLLRDKRLLSTYLYD